ncbi:MAG: hypothetical protein IAE82_05900 [Opitutaceae bacterium]|nr:hypothetical protein [Opitutaceae bacterium]
MPYVAAYAVYDWLDLPIHTRSGHTTRGDIWPPLVTVFGAITLSTVAAGLVWLGIEISRPKAMGRSWLFARQSLPWICLGMILLLPGIYLEFPADPWEHLFRICEWDRVTSIAAHSASAKATYLIAYSLVDPVPDSWRHAAFNMIAAGSGLLLAWNAYRLGRATALRRSFAYLFTIAYVLLLGNSTFSFFRYYGISSSILSQVASLAIIRIAALESPRSILQWSAWSFRGGAARAATYGSLLLVALYSHRQGIVLACTGIGAIATWHLLRARPRLAIWGFAGSFVFGWWMLEVIPSWAEPLQALRSAGWLAPWGGFNLFTPGTVACERGMHILGLTGILNLTAGAILAANNRLAGWLTLAPVVVLIHPLSAFPLAYVLNASPDSDALLVFHRVLLGIPAGLALVTLAAILLSRERSPSASLEKRPAAPMAAVAATLLIVVVPAGAPWYNRLWNLTAVTPNDLAMTLAQADAVGALKADARPQGDILVGSSGLNFVFQIEQFQRTPFDPVSMHRLYRHPVPRTPAEDIWVTAAYLQNPTRPPISAIVPDPSTLISCASQAAIASGHWLPQEVALAFSGPECIDQLATERQLQREFQGRAVRVRSEERLTPSPDGRLSE